MWGHGTLFTEAKSCIERRMMTVEVMSVGFKKDCSSRCLISSISIPASSAIARFVGFPPAITVQWRVVFCVVE